MTITTITLYSIYLSLWPFWFYYSNQHNLFLNYFYNVGYGLLMLFSFSLFLSHAKNFVLAKKPLIVLALGSLSFFAANSIWFYNNLQTNLEVPYPSTADFFWLLFYLFSVIGFGTLLKYLEISLNVTNLIETIVISLVIFLPLYSFMRTNDINSSQDALVKLLNIIYPLLDSILISIFIIAIRTQTGSFKPHLLLFLFSFVCFVSADTIFAYQNSKGVYWNGNNVDFIYTLGCACFALGASFIPNLIKSQKTTL